MPTYPDLQTVTLAPFPEKFWRSLHEPLRCQSVLDVGSGHSGVHDCDYWTAQPLNGRKASCDIFRCRLLPAAWEIHNGVDVCKLVQHFGRKSFDLVQCFEVLEHVEDSRQALEQLCEVASRLVLVSSADEKHHEGPEQEAAERINKHQRYIRQPKVSDLVELGFEVRVNEQWRRQLLAWRIM